MKGKRKHLRKKYVHNCKNTKTKYQTHHFFPSLLNNTLSPQRSFSSAKSVIIRDDSSYIGTNPL